MIALYIIDNTEMPNWADASQVFIGALGIIATVITLWKLMKKDEEREKEIASLANIAEQLKEMMVHNKNVFKESKKPHIEVLAKRQSGEIGRLYIKNVNPHAVLTNFLIPDETHSAGMSTAIKTDKATQEFSYDIIIGDMRHNDSKDFDFVYYIDDIFKYSQTIKVTLIGSSMQLDSGIIESL